MDVVFKLMRLFSLAAAALVSANSFAAAQADPERPVTPPDSYRIVMENERVRMIEIHVKPHSKVKVESPPERERFLYMLSDGALILAPPGKTPYEFALHAGETAVFPAVSPTVENDTDSAVRALMVEVKQPMRSTAVAGKAKGRGKYAARGKSRVTYAVRSKPRTKQATRSRAPQASTTSSSAAPSGNAPLNLRKANAKPPKRVTGKTRGSSS
jgi:quercetin dioxygenase-like cupin family protein